MSGKEYLKYGGDTTCLEIRSDHGDLIVVDAGSGIRNLGNKMIQEPPRAFTMLFTHAHWDHLMGFPFFKPIFATGNEISLICDPLGLHSPHDIFSGIMRRPFFPVELNDKDVRAHLSFQPMPSHPFTIGTISISTIHLSHPKDGGFGFRFQENDKVFVFLTDNELGHVHKGGCTFDQYRQFSENADLLIHDAEYETEEYQQILKNSAERWGHSVVTDVIKLGSDANVRRLGFFHHNAMRTDRQLDTIIRNARKKLLILNNQVDCFAVGSTFEITL